VAAAKLQTALQASGAVPLLQAAAGRERRLAAAAALARQRLALEAPSSDISKPPLHLLPADDLLQEGPSARLQQQMQKLTQAMALQTQLLQETLQKQQNEQQKHEVCGCFFMLSQLLAHLMQSLHLAGGKTCCHWLHG